MSVVKLLARPPVVFYLSGRISTRRLPDLESLKSLEGSGEWAIVDEIQLRQEVDGIAGFETELPRWEVVKVEENTLGAATRLDVDPSATASGRPSPPERLWLLKPARPR